MQELLRYIAHVKRILRCNGRLEQDAEDLVQEAFVRLEIYRRDHDVRTPEAFLVRTALNLSVDAHRRDQCHPVEALVEETVFIDSTPGP